MAAQPRTVTERAWAEARVRAPAAKPHAPKGKPAPAAKPAARGN
jgi:hypothetical protein